MQELAHLDWYEVLKNIQKFATSGSGKMIILATKPMSSGPEAEQSMSSIFDAMELLQSGVRPHMESLDLFETWYIRLKKSSVLKSMEIKDVRSFCIEVLALKDVAQKVNNVWSRSISEQLMDSEEPLSAIDQIFTSGGDIRSDASERLFQLHKEQENLFRQVQNTLDRLVKDHEMNSFLQDKYVTTREGRWVLPVKSGMQNFMDGVIHGSSQTKQTVFMEPQAVIPMNNRLRQVVSEIDDEIERLLTKLSEYLFSLVHSFSRSKEILEHTDVILAKAQWSSIIEARALRFSEKDILLNEVKHPLLVISGKNVVANTVALNDKKSILLLSGPNAGGKTVLLKSIGLTAQMARCGLPVSVGEHSEMPFFKEILVGIGDAQSVGEELSTFASHLKILDKASKLEGFKNLILIDEICGSTDPEEGGALARSFIEAFGKNSIFAVITSHLGPLKTGWSKEDQILNGSLEYDLEKGKPTYQFLQGVPGDSLAIQTAKRIGISTGIVSRATDLLSPQTRARLSQMEELEQIKSDIQMMRDTLRKEQAKAETEKQKYQALSEKIEKSKEDILHKVRQTAEKKIDEMIGLAKADQTFKRHKSLQEIKHQLPEVIKSRVGVQSTQVDTLEEFSKRYPPGSKVYIQTLRQDGIVQSAPNSRGEVVVLSNSMRLTLPWADLKLASQAANPTASIIRQSAAATFALMDSDKVLDLRGKTADEAISALEIQLDASALHKEDRIKIIHGHGTDTLKKAVRAYLSRSVYVKKWQAGTSEQGGDGVTWAELSED